MTATTPVTVGKRVCPLLTRDIVDRIVRFIEAFTDTELYTYQSLFIRRIIESVLENDGATITGLWARQSGKSESVSAVCVGTALILPELSKQFPDDPRLSGFANGFLTGVYAPVKEQAELVFTRMRQRVTSERGLSILEDPELDLGVVTDRADTLVFSNGSMLMARSASPDSQIEGKTFHLVIVEEAQKVLRTKMEKEIRPFLASTNGTLTKIGTAWESRGGFHISIQQNIESHQKGGKRNHFEFPYDIVVSEKRRAYEKDNKAFHLKYEKFVNQEMFESGGKDSPEFRMNFMCMWQDSRVIAVRQNIFREAAIEDLEASPNKFGRQVAGLDIGKVNDPTVLTVMSVDWGSPIKNPFRGPEAEEDKQLYHRKTIVDWLELRGSFEGETGQYRALIEYLLRTNVEVLVIDATSIGDPVFERIEAMIGGSITCVPYKYTAQTKSNLFKYYLTEMHSGRVKYAAGPDTRMRHEYRKFQEEHLNLDKEEWAGYAVCNAPDGGHDDYPNSAALACWAEKIADEAIMPEIVSSAPDGGRESGRRYGGSESFMGQPVGGGGSSGSSGMMGMTASVGSRASRYGRWK